MAGELARGVQRTYLPNGFWINTVEVRAEVRGGSFHTLVYNGLTFAAQAERRSRTREDALGDHEALIALYVAAPRAEAKQRGKRRAA